MWSQKIGRPADKKGFVCEDLGHYSTVQFNMRNSSINYLFFLHSFTHSKVKITKTENVGKSGCCFLRDWWLLCVGVIPGLLLLALLHVLRHT